MYHLRKTSSQPHLLAPAEACEPGLTHQSTAHLNQTVLPRIDLNLTQASGQFWTSGTIEKIDTLAIILPAVYIYSKPEAAEGTTWKGPAEEREPTKEQRPVLMLLFWLSDPATLYLFYFVLIYFEVFQVFKKV